AREQGESVCRHRARDEAARAAHARIARAVRRPGDPVTPRFCLAAPQSLTGSGLAFGDAASSASFAPEPAADCAAAAEILGSSSSLRCATRCQIREFVGPADHHDELVPLQGVMRLILTRKGWPRKGPPT